MNIRRFQFSSVSTSAADMSARILGEKNDMTRSLRPSEPKSLSRARARPKPHSHDPDLASSWHPSSLKEGKFELGSPSCQPQRPTRVHAKNSPLPSRNLLFPSHENSFISAPFRSVWISGRICSEKVVHPGIYYEALQLMTLRKLFWPRNPRPSIG